jgi:ubiquinone/menaquinone biosynthesis C-methylase UbiE
MMELSTGGWVGLGIGSLFGVLLYIYLMLKVIYRRRMGGLVTFLTYTLCIWLWIFAFEPPRRRKKKLKMAGIKKGQVVLDAGCGIGRYTVSIARMAGERGRVYALDIQPLHVILVKARARIAGLGNVHTVLRDIARTGLNTNSIDTVFMADAFHEYGDKPGALREVNRILKPNGVLFIDEHEMRERKFLDIVASVELFTLEQKEGKLYRYRKSGSG